MRSLFTELLPEADVLQPDELASRLALGQRPDGLVIDGTQLLELGAAERATALALPRVLICTGLSLASLPMNLISGPGVAIMAKPFCVEDLEAAIEWLRGAPTAVPPSAAPSGSLVQRRRPRRPRGPLPAS